MLYNCAGCYDLPVMGNHHILGQAIAVKKALEREQKEMIAAGGSVRGGGGGRGIDNCTFSSSSSSSSSSHARITLELGFCGRRCGENNGVFCKQ